MLPKGLRRQAARFWLLLALVATFIAGGTATAVARTGGGRTSGVHTTSLGTYSPTFVGPAATGCSSGCHLLFGPYRTPSVANLPSAAPTSTQALPDTPRALPSPMRPGPRGVTAAAITPQIPTVSCQPLGPGCDSINSGTGGAVGVKGLNAVDSATHTNNPFKDIEPPDQGLCAGKGYVLEDNNLGEMQIFNTSLQKVSPVISLDQVMGLTSRGWSSGGDISCAYDQSNGGHWFITEIVSATPEVTGGAFAGCFGAVANTCYEGIAVTKGNSPYGPYNVYFVNANYNQAEPGAPFLLNDFAKIGMTRDAFLLFYDEFPLDGGGFGGGFFNGAQEFAFNKTAMERGVPVTRTNGSPSPGFNVAIENMGLLRTPDGTCASDNTYHQGGVTCWYSVIPAEVPDAADWDNSHGGTGFMANTLDFYGQSDNRLAVWEWTGLSALHSPNCLSCARLRFGGQLFSGVDRYYDPPVTPSGVLAPQKIGPIPLGDECGKAGLSVGNPPPASCPENGLATNGDNITQLSQAGGHLWAPVSTEVSQTFSSQPTTPELHMGAVYWVLGTQTFDTSGKPSLTSQSYVSPAHEDLTMPVTAGQGASRVGGNKQGIIAFTLTGNGGINGADHGGYYPSTAYGRLNARSPGLTGSTINIADLGKAPQDGFSEYQGYPGSTRPRWGDYSAAQFLPGSGGRIYFATNYIQYPNCMPPAFTLTIGTCGGTRDGDANWGTSVNYVVP